MAQHITSRHLDFVNEAKEAFESNAKLHTYRDEEETLIALRYGEDRDCVLVYELGECVGNFVQQISPDIRKVLRDES